MGWAYFEPGKDWSNETRADMNAQARKQHEQDGRLRMNEQFALWSAPMYISLTYFLFFFLYFMRVRIHYGK